MDNILSALSRRIGRALILAGVAACFCGIMYGLAQAAGDIDLKLAHFMSPMHIQHQESFLPFAQNVEKMTQGRVRIRIYPGGALGGPMQLPDAVRSGITDIAFIVPSYSTGRFPRSSVLDLPFLSDQSQKACRIFYDVYDDYLAGDFRDYKVLWLYSSDPGQLFTVTGAIKTLEDLKGKKIRSPSAAMSDALALLGAHPVSMPISELHNALDKGIIDGMLSPTTAIHDFKLFDLLHYGTRVNMFTSLLMVVMNKEKFASLPDFARKAIDEAAGRKWGLRASGIYDRLDAEVWAKLKSSKRVQLNELSSEERRRFLDRLKPMEAKWIEMQSGRRIPARAILKAVQDAAARNR